MRAERLSRRNWPVVLALAAATILAYGNVFWNEFVNFDDTLYVYQNRWVQQGLTLASLRWAFGFADKHGTYWQPLTWLSLMFDHAQFGLNPLGYHAVNLLLHVVNACLLFAAMRRLTRRYWCSALVAALFALHPINVESVAWAAERKSVLSSLFWMLALGAYPRYVTRRSRPAYLAVWAAMGVGLLAKSMLVTLPFALLLLDFWPLARLRAAGEPPAAEKTRPTLWQLLLEKVPLAALSILSVAVSMYSVRPDPRRHVAAPSLSLGGRVAEALVSYVRYLGKLAWPTELAVFYPSQDSYPAWQVLGAAVALIAVTLLAVRLRRAAPWFLVGWLWFIGVLLPASGLLRAGLWPALADRFAYLPSIGLFVIVAFLAARLADRGRRARILVASLAVAALGALGVCTWVQVGHWHDSVSLFTHTLAATGENPTAYVNLANALARSGREQEAAEYLSRALAADPQNRIAHANLADVLRRAGRLDDAVAHYRAALREGSADDAIVHCNLGAALMQSGKVAEATGEFRAAIAVDPGYATAHYDLGVAFAEQGDDARAIPAFREALRLDPAFGAAHNDLGLSLMKLGRVPDAIAAFDDALRANPDDAFAYYNKATALERLGRVDEAITQLREVLRRTPADADAARDLERLSAGSTSRR